MNKILVTPRSLSANPLPELDALTEAGFELVFPSPGRQPDEAELIKLVQGCVGWLAGVEPVSIGVIDAADRLRAISRNGVGVDNLPVAELDRRGIHVLRAEGANSIGVAELTIGLMLSALRNIPTADAGIKSGGWPRNQGFEISGRTVGLLGCGAIGRHAAQITSAMGARVVAYDPFRPAFDLPGPFEWLEMDQVFERSDIVSLHCPPSPDHSPIVDARRLKLMKPGSVLINTARAILVDESAVLAALEDGTLSVFATDVFPQEPPMPGSLAIHPKVVATSHIGGFTRESVSRSTQIAVRNLLVALKSGQRR